MARRPVQAVLPLSVLRAATVCGETNSTGSDATVWADAARVPFGAAA